LQGARVHRGALLGLLLCGLLLGRLGLGHMPPGKAAADGAQYGVMAGIVTGHRATAAPLMHPLALAAPQVRARTAARPQAARLDGFMVNPLTMD